MGGDGVMGWTGLRSTAPIPPMMYIHTYIHTQTAFFLTCSASVLPSPRRRSAAITPAKATEAVPCAFVCRCQRMGGGLFLRSRTDLSLWLCLHTKTDLDVVVEVDRLVRPVIAQSESVRVAKVLPLSKRRDSGVHCRMREFRTVRQTPRAASHQVLGHRTGDTRRAIQQNKDVACVRTCSSTPSPKTALADSMNSVTRSSYALWVGVLGCINRW